MTQTQSVDQRIAGELGVAVRQVSAAVELLDGGATVPFIARYRKEATGTLDDAQLRTLEERLRYLRELDERRDAILKEITAQGKLTGELEAQIRAADSKARLEDLYLPYKPKRRTKAQIAREAGLEPLADLLLADPARDPQAEAADFVDPDKDVADAAAALDGARAILVERFAEDADLLGELRESMAARGSLTSRVREGQERRARSSPTTSSSASRSPGCPRTAILALFRGEKEEILDLTLEPGRRRRGERGPHRRALRHQRREPPGRPVAHRHRALGLAHPHPDAPERRHPGPAVAGGRGRGGPGVRRQPARPAAGRPGRGADHDRPGPGLPHRRQGRGHRRHRQGPRHRHDLPARAAAPLGRGHRHPRQAGPASISADLVAIGNGTASRETDRLAADLIKRHPELKLTKVVVSEAGASVYSASAYASEELPGMDVSLRGAVSIARRLQDPLAELVKIDPKSIGVGQYQHDVAEGKLSHSLDAVVEDCVNAVGVDLNTASQPLLARVSGITAGLATAIVARRDSEGPFRTRQQLMRVPRLGPKAFEQCAGFLRIRGGDDPLDASGVHPEAYPVVRRILAATGKHGGRPDRQHRRAPRAEARSSSPTTGSACRPSPTSCASWRSRAATRVPRSPPRRSPRASRSSRTSSPAWCSRAW